jgi:hypothetical protein
MLFQWVGADDMGAAGGNARVSPAPSPAIFSSPPTPERIR